MMRSPSRSRSSFSRTTAPTMARVGGRKAYTWPTHRQGSWRASASSKRWHNAGSALLNTRALKGTASAAAR